MKVKFFRTVDAFLYLPTYIAQYRGIYRQIDKQLNVEFHTPGSDWLALKTMIEESKNNDTVPIAICDPFVMFNGGLTQLGLKPTDMRVLGAIITKVPFWAVDKTNIEIKEEERLQQFDNIIYYNNRLITGYYIGRRTAEIAGIQDEWPVNFGEEFRSQQFSNPNVKTLAVTCDIIAMAQNHDAPHNPISINHHYAKNPHYKDFITTALVTTAGVCQRHPEYTATVLNGIQSSMGVLLSSEEVALSVCMELAEKDEFYQAQHGSGT